MSKRLISLAVKPQRGSTFSSPSTAPLARGAKAISTVSSPRTTEKTVLLPSGTRPRRRSSAGICSQVSAVTGSPSTATTRSPAFTPALRAGLPSSVPETTTPFVASNAMLRSKSRSGWKRKPNQAQPALPSVRSAGSTSRMVGEGIVKAWSPKMIPRALRPTTRPAVSTSGPPELPGLIAASVWYQSV